jgi:ankyrin repeat protein
MKPLFFHVLSTAGADITGQTLYGNTVLHAAARHNQLIIVDMLLKHGAKLNPNVFGKTVTEVAKEAGAFSAER